MNNMKHIIFLILLFGSCSNLFGQAKLDQLRQKLLRAPVQEKVYLHLDNQCYFVGDTLWYKAYVTRADNLRPTNLSRILYVELVSSDGLVVERQTVDVTPTADGYACGSFALKDSLYSGYYEVRAYTRWMLNFAVTEHPYSRKDWEQFYNRQMAKDFFREYGTVYSRVVAVYSKPASAGDYGVKDMVPRPKQRADAIAPPRLTVAFYPEGGNLIAGCRARVAFEATNQLGECVAVRGRVNGKAVRTTHMGRGAFEVDVPDHGALTADFEWNGAHYSFDLPEIRKRGVSLRLKGNTVRAKLVGDTQRLYAMAVLCRGALKVFKPLAFKANGECVETVDASRLPTGVNNLVVFDEDGNVVADRLFFVNHHDYDDPNVRVGGLADIYDPFERGELSLRATPGVSSLSLSIRDASTDDPTYDSGNIMTDLLLSSELKGFVAHPDYYFEKDDAAHRQALDLLLLVQGWRRYDFREIVAAQPLRYQPEKVQTVEGCVYKNVDFDEIEPEELPYWRQGVFGWSTARLEQEYKENKENKSASKDDQEQSVEFNNVASYLRALERIDYGSEASSGMSIDGKVPMASTPSHVASHGTSRGYSDNTDRDRGVNRGSLRHEVMFNSELVLDQEIYALDTLTFHGGRFCFDVPPYFGDGILFMSAHKSNLSKKAQDRLDRKGALDEERWPEYYVKRDLFYPVFAKKYSWYQTHRAPVKGHAWEEELEAADDSLPKVGKTLGNVEVRARRRRVKLGIDWSKPAYEYDTYELYNLATDYGLSFGKFNARRFPIQLGILLLGTYGSERMFNVDARMNDYMFYRSYNPVNSDSPYTKEAILKIVANRSNYAVYKDLFLKRQWKTRVYTDFELRNEDKPLEMSMKAADITFDFVTLPDDATRHSFRDRRIILHGFTEPREFYQPNYKDRPLPDTKDYRRTLYWNPNVKCDKNGEATIRFYNNAKTTKVKLSVAGLCKNGKMIYNP